MAIRDGYALRTAAIGPLETMDIAGLDLIQTVLVTSVRISVTTTNPVHCSKNDSPRAGMVSRAAPVSSSTTTRPKK